MLSLCRAAAGFLPSTRCGHLACREPALCIEQDSLPLASRPALGTQEPREEPQAWGDPAMNQSAEGISIDSGLPLSLVPQLSLAL